MTPLKLHRSDDEGERWSSSPNNQGVNRNLRGSKKRTEWKFRLSSETENIFLWGPRQSSSNFMMDSLHKAFRPSHHIYFVCKVRKWGGVFFPIHLAFQCRYQFWIHEQLFCVLKTDKENGIKVGMVCFWWSASRLLSLSMQTPTP